jgi:NitT/TauT family transport system ATP-binding protein
MEVEMAPQALHLVGQAPPLLRAENVTLEYRDSGNGRASERVVRAAENVSFDVHEGDRFILLGPSGCGKSSLLRAIGGFFAPTDGRFTIDGAPITSPGPDRITVFQEFDQLPPWKTVLQNVMFPLLKAKRLPKHEARDIAMHWIARIGLERFANAYPHTLSGGMKQRVAIARALAMRSRVLLMDEPFAALDALTRRKMQEELGQLWEEERFTLLFVTHSIEEALIVGNRILLLSPHPGRVRAELNAHQFGMHSAGSAEFQAAAQRIHELLFEQSPAPATDVGAERIAL